MPLEELRKYLISVPSVGPRLRRVWVEEWLTSSGAADWMWREGVLILRYPGQNFRDVEPIRLRDRGMFYPISALARDSDE